MGLQEPRALLGVVFVADDHDCDVVAATARVRSSDERIADSLRSAVNAGLLANLGVEDRNFKLRFREYSE
jgi:hypothetical protein